MDMRVGWQPKQQGAGVGSTLEAPIYTPVLQQLPLLKPSCHGLTQTQGPGLEQAIEKGASCTSTLPCAAFPWRPQVPRGQANRAGSGGWPAEGAGGDFLCPELCGPLSSACPLRRMRLFTRVFPQSVYRWSVCAHYAEDICAPLVCVQDLLCLCAQHCNVCVQGVMHMCASMWYVSACFCVCKQLCIVYL